MTQARELLLSQSRTLGKSLNLNFSCIKWGNPGLTYPIELYSKDGDDDDDEAAGGGGEKGFLDPAA